MSLLKRIERSGAQPQVDGAPNEPPAGLPWRPAAAQREESDATRLSIQQRVISELDPKVDLADGERVRREIDEIFSRTAD